MERWLDENRKVGKVNEAGSAPMTGDNYPTLSALNCKVGDGILVLTDIANTASSEIGHATEMVSEAVGKAATIVGTTVSDATAKAVNWPNRDDDGILGLYGSPGTCVPSVFDPIAGAVYTGLDMKEKGIDE